MNSVELTGRLVQDPEIRETATGNKVSNITLAVKRPQTKDITDFYTVILWNQTAMYCSQYGKKGSIAEVTGYLTTRQWEDNKGSKHTSVEIVALQFSLLTPKSNAETGEFKASQSSSTHTSPVTKTSQKKPTLQAMDDDGDIPF